MAKKKSTSKKSYNHDDHNFIIIAGGGFIVLMLIFMSSGVMFGGKNSRTQSKVQASEFVEKKVIVNDIEVSPSVMSITRGTTVTWTNDGENVHSISSDDGTFETGELKMGQSASITFDTVGTYEYQDLSNSSIRGTVVVK